MSNINNKLDYLDETKQLIKQAIIDKGQEVSDEDTFRSYVDKISDIETGNDTKDATATSNDILYPETAYISNGKVTGNIMPAYSSNTTLSQTNTISRSLSYSLLDINYDAKIAIISDEDYKFNFCNIVNNEIDYENSAYITLNDFEEGMDGTYSFSKCCTNFDKNTNDLYLYLLFTFQNTFKVFCYIYNIKTKSSKYIDTYELTIDDANNNLVLNMMVRPNYPNQVIVFAGYRDVVVSGSFLTTVFLQFNTVALELQKIEDTISTSGNQYAAKVESCYFTSNGEYLCINVRTGTLSGTTQNGIIYHCVNNFLEQIVDSVQYVTLFENGNYIAYNQSTRNHCLFNIDGDVLHSYSGNLGEVSTEQLTYTNKCILGNYLFGFAYPEDFINPTDPLILYCCKLNEDYTIIKEYEIDVGSRTLFNCYNAILYDNKTTRNFDGYLGDTEKEIISLERNNTVYFSTKDSDVTKNDVLQGKIFYNSEGKQIGNKIFTDYNDSVGVLETNSAISVTAVDQLIGIEMSILPDIKYLDKVKVNDIVKAVITIIDTATSSTTLKCNCLVQILEIIDHSDKQFRANVKILTADVNTEDGTATSEDIVEGKIAYVNNQRIKGTAQLGIDTSNATAMANDILAPKTAYVNDQKITGSMKCSYVSLGDANAVNITGDVSFWVVDLERQLAINGSKRLIHIRRIESNVIGDTDALTIDLSTYSVPEQFNIYSAKFSIDADTNSVGVWASLNNTNINSAFIFLELDVKTLEVLNTPIYKEFNLDLYNSTNSNYVSALNIFPRPTYRNQIGFLRKTTDTKYGIVLIEASSTDMSIIDSTSQGYWIPGGETVGGTEFTCTWSSDGRYIWGRSRAAGTFRWKGNFRILYDCTQRKTLSSDYDIILFNDKYALSRSTLYRLPDMSVAKSGLSFSFLSGNSSDIEPSNIWCGFCGKYTVFCENNNLHRMIFNETNLTISTDSTITISSGTPLCNAVPNKYLTWVKDNKISGYQYLDDSLLVSIERDGIMYYNTYDANPNASNILANTVVYGDVGKVVGTMPNNNELNYNSSEEDQIIPEGYTSGGTIKGFDITASLVYQTSEELCNTILGVESNPLRKLEYIETSGTQYLVTDITISNSMKLIFKYRPVKIAGGQCLFGTTGNNNIYVYASGYGGHSNQCGGSFFGSEFSLTSSVKTEDVVLTITNNSISYVSSTVNTNKSYTSYNNSGILQICNNNRYNEKGSFRLYAVEVYENDELTHNLLPAMNLITNETGLYDYITEKMYTNSGSGEFTKGGVI